MREERKRETEKRERERESGGSTDKCAPPPRGVHVSKTAGWPNVNGFDSWMVEDTRFWISMAKIKLGQ